MRARLVILLLLGTAATTACDSAPAVDWSPEPPAEEVVAAEPAPTPAEPVDPDALPTGALRRLGTSAFAHSETILAVAWSGDRIATGGLDGVSVWDARSGWRYGAVNTPSTELALSGAGSVVAMAREGSRQVGLWRVGDAAPYLTAAVGPISVSALAFAPDDSLLAVASSTGQISLVSPTTGQTLAEIESGRRALNALAFDPSGGRLAAAGQDGRLLVFTVPDGASALAVETGMDGVTDVSFAPSGQLIAVAARSSVDVSIYDAETGAPWGTLSGHDSAVLGVRFLPDSDLLATTGLDQTVRRWRVDSALEVEPRIGPWQGGGVVRFSRWPGSDGVPRPRLVRSPDGSEGAVAGWSNSLRRFSWLANDAGGRPTGSGPVTALTFSRDGGQIGVGNEDGMVSIWGIDGSLRQRLTGHRTPIVTVRFEGNVVWARSTLEERSWALASGQSLSVAGGQIRSPGSLAFDAEGRLNVGGYGQVLICDPRSGLEWRVLETSPRQYVSLATQAAGRTLALGRNGDSAVVFEARSGRRLMDLPQLADHRAAVLSADGTAVAALGRTRDVSVWDVESGERTFYFEPLNRVEHLALSPRGDHLVAGARGDLYIWELPSGRVRQPAFGGHLSALAWSADGAHVVAAGHRQIMSYELAAWNATHVVDMRGHAVALSSDGRLIAALHGDGTINLWENGNLEPLLELDTESPNGQGSVSGTPSLAFSPDDTMLAAIDRFNRLTVWDLASGERRLRLGDGEVAARANGVAAESADGSLSARLAEDGTVEVVRGGEPGGDVVGRLGALGAPVTSLAFSPDGSLLATGLANTSALLWEVANLPPVATPQ